MAFLVSPLELIGENGKITGVRMIKNRLGEPDASGRRSPVPSEGSEYILKADTVIPAVSGTRGGDSGIAGQNPAPCRQTAAPIPRSDALQPRISFVHCVVFWDGPI